MSNALPKVQALISRALDAAASEEEARTCAFTAVRLMAKYGLTVGGAPVSWRQPVEAPRPEPTPEPAAPKSEERPRYTGPRRKSYGKATRVEIDARFGGKCAHCGERYHTGDRISWKRGAETYHAACAAESEAA